MVDSQPNTHINLTPHWKPFFSAIISQEVKKSMRPNRLFLENQPNTWLTHWYWKIAAESNVLESSRHKTHQFFCVLPHSIFSIHMADAYLRHRSIPCFYTFYINAHVTIWYYKNSNYSPTWCGDIVECSVGIDNLDRIYVCIFMNAIGATEVINTTGYNQYHSIIIAHWK